MSTKTREEIQELLTLHSLGLLEGDELKEVEELLRSRDVDAETYLEDVNNVFSQLAYSLDDKPLSPDVKKRVFDQIEDDKLGLIKAEEPGFIELFNFFWFKLSAVAACLIIGLLTYYNVHLNQKLSQTNSEITRLQSDMDDDKMLKSFLDNPMVKVVQLESPESDMKLYARLFWDRAKNSALLCIIDVPEITNDKTYQFWVDSETDMESIGMFSSTGEVKEMPMSDKMMMINAMPFKESKSMEVYVSVEPSGGMPHPTGKTYLLGKL